MLMNAICSSGQVNFNLGKLILASLAANSYVKHWLTLFTRQQVKFEWTLEHQEAFMKLKDFHHTSTNSEIPQPQQRYSLHRHFRWYLWSPVDTGTGWYWISNCLLISHFFGDLEKVEHNWIRGLWSLLCCHQMELLSQRCRHHSQKWPQATHKIFWMEKMLTTR